MKGEKDGYNYTQYFACDGWNTSWWIDICNFNVWGRGMDSKSLDWKNIKAEESLSVLLEMEKEENRALKKENMRLHKRIDALKRIIMALDKKGEITDEQLENIAIL